MQTDSETAKARSGSVQPDCSALPRRQLEILDHTEHRAAGGLYCGGGPNMDALVNAGLMEYVGRKSFVPDLYYRITSKGRAALRAQNAKLTDAAVSDAGKHK